MSRAVLSLGSNLGDRLGRLQGALDALSASGIEIVAVSGVYETAPVGGPDQDDFLNAVAIVETTLSPLDLLGACQRVEADHDRVREVRWGPRTLDVDIIAFDDLILDEPVLTLPHPRAHERAFVCVPWMSIDRHATLPQGPITGLSLDDDGVSLRPDLVLMPPTSAG